MIDYLIKLDYVLGYQRFQNRQNAFKPEETCQIGIANFERTLS